jgi:integrase
LEVVSYGEVDPLTEFFDSIRSPLTKKMYTKRLDLFLKHLKMDGDTLKQRAKAFAEKARSDPQWATYQINEYMRFQKSRSEKGEITESTLANFWKPVKLFCDQNDIILNWKKILRRVPAGRRFSNDRVPTREEILQILQYPDRRIKPIIFTMVSSGIRVGAWDYLQWKHVEPIEKKGELIAARLTIYAGEESDEYRTFISPEAYKALKEWMDLRASHGEKISGESFLMRDLWDATSMGKGCATKGFASMPKQLKTVGVTRLIQRALRASGFRQGLPPGKRRYEFSALHSFRKFAKTAYERHMKSLSAEMLLGHDVGLHANYDRLPETDLLNDYLRALPELTFFETPKPSEDIESLKAKNQDLESRLVEMERQLAEDRKKAVEDREEMRELLKLIRGNVVGDEC